EGDNQPPARRVDDWLDCGHRQVRTQDLSDPEWSRCGFVVAFVPLVDLVARIDDGRAAPRRAPPFVAQRDLDPTLVRFLHCKRAKSSRADRRFVFNVGYDDGGGPLPLHAAVPICEGDNQPPARRVDDRLDRGHRQVWRFFLCLWWCFWQEQ